MLRLLFTGLTVLVAHAICQIIIDHRIQIARNSGCNCVLKLAQQFFEQGSNIGFSSNHRLNRAELRSNATFFYAYNTMEQFVINRFMQEERWTILTKTCDRPEIYDNVMEDKLIIVLEKIHNYVMFTKNSLDFEKTLHSLKLSKSWNPQAKFIVYIDCMFHNDVLKMEFLKQLFKIGWHYWIANMIIFIPEKGIGHRIYTWFPFSEGNCGKQNISIVQLGMCVNQSLVPDDAAYFPQKVPHSLSQCQVPISTIAWPPFIISHATPTALEPFSRGIEIELINTIAKQTNFTPVFKFLEAQVWGEVFSDTNGTGLMGELIRENANIVIGAITPSAERHKYFEFSYQYMQDEVTWIVPSPIMIPAWHSLFFIFTTYTWTASFFVYIVVTKLAWCLVRKTDVREELPSYRKFSKIPLVMFALLVNNTASRYPKTNALRCLVFFWAIFCFHMFNAYMAALMSRLTGRTYANGIDDFYEIIHSRIEFGMSSPLLSYFDKTFGLIDDEIGAKVVAMHKQCDSSLVCLDRIARKKDFAMALSRKYFEFVENNFRDANGDALVKAIRDNVVSPPVEMLFVKGYPLLSRINSIILQITEAGLINFWTAKIKESIAYIDYEDIKSKSNQQVLSLFHLVGAFLVLAVGLLISMVAFIIECYVERIRKWFAEFKTGGKNRKRMVNNRRH